MKKFVALAVASLGLAVGCTSQPQPEPDTSTSASPSLAPSVSSSPSAEPSPSPEPSPTPSPSVVESFQPATTLSAEDEAILHGLKAYYSAYEKFAADPTLTDLTETQNVTAGESSKVIAAEIVALRENGHIAVGERFFLDVTVEESKTTDGQSALISYCNDRSRVRVLDAKTGEDTGHRPTPFVQGTATLELGADGKWRVSTIRNEPVNSC